MFTTTHRLATAVIVAVTALTLGAPLASAASQHCFARHSVAATALTTPFVSTSLELDSNPTTVVRGPVADLGW
jgi:hypothetical protein